MQGGDVEFKRFCERYYPEILEVSRQIIPDPPTAEDVAIETFEVALSEFERGKAVLALTDPDSFLQQAFVTAFFSTLYSDLMEARAEECYVDSRRTWEPPAMDSGIFEPQDSASPGEVYSPPSSAALRSFCMRKYPL